MTVVASSIILNFVSEYGWFYVIMFYIPKIAPIFLVGLYYFQSLNFRWFKKGLTIFSRISLILAFAVGSVLLGLAIQNYPTGYLTFSSKYSWTYEAALEWVFCFIAVWLISEFKTADSTLALVFASLAISVGGDMHEWIFGIFNVNLYYSPTYPLFIATSIVSLVFLVLMARDYDWSATRIFWVCLTIYIIFMVLYGTVFNPNNASALHIPGFWVQRLPSIFLLLGVAHSLRRGNHT